MSTRRSLVLSFAQKYSEIAIRLLGTIALARLLSPAEFGVFAVASAFFVIGAAIARFGLDSYLIRARDLTVGGLGTAFGISVASHGAVAIVLGGAAILSPAWLVDETLSELILILAAGLLLGPLTLLLGARLQRDMRFGMLYVIGSVQAVVSVSVAIGLALAGMGPSSLAASAVAEAMCVSAAALFLSGKYPLPRLGLAGWRSAVGFGITATFIDTLKRIGDSAPGLALASLSGYGAAGLFSRAQAVVALFDRGVLHGISPVILPLLASRQRGGQSLAPIYLQKVAYLSALAWPFFLFVILYADAIVRLILGDQWVEAAPIVRLFALAGLLLPLVQMNQKFYVALGLQHLYLRIQVIDQFGKVALVLLLCLIDFRLVALAFLFENALKGVLTYRPLREGLGYQPSELYRALRLSAWTTLSALAIPMAIAVVPLTDNPFVDLGAAGLGAGAGWFAALILIRHPLSEEVTRGAARLLAAAPGGAAWPR